MNTLPDRPNLGHLKKQAKDLIRRYRSRDPHAIAQLRDVLPAAAGLSDDAIVALDLRLHDAQSSIARSCGFASWADLASYVEVRSRSSDRRARVLDWLGLVYAGDVRGGVDRANPRVAARVLAENPDLAANDPYLACAVGDEGVLRLATNDDPAWVARPGGPLRLPPLVAVTHSSLVQIAQFHDDLVRSARFLLAAGADPNQCIHSRWWPASVSEPDDTHRLSVLYGAAGRNHDPDLTKMLLDAGADPNDNESLYHSLEDRSEKKRCTSLLLENGARVVGSNAMFHVLDFDDVVALKLLLGHGADPNERPSNPPLTEWGSPLLWAIYRRRSRQHIEALLRAGANPRVTTPSGITPHSLALQFGLGEVADLLRERGAAAPISEETAFLAACARGDEAEARRIRAGRPEWPAALSPERLRLLPDMAAAGGDVGVRVMVKLSWPIDARGGDWDASALNLAVFRGNAVLTRFLLEHGASWEDEHGYDDNACGTLSWASCNEPVEGGDWVGCARALRDHGMPRAIPDPQDPDLVLIDGRRKRFSEEVNEVLLGEA